MCITFCIVKFVVCTIVEDAPVKNVIGIFSCLLDGSLVENDPKSYENPFIFLANTMEIPYIELVQNPCHVPAWKTNIICA